MMTKSAFRPLLSRTLTSLAAIIAVSAIFGAKALEIERRDAAAAPAAKLSRAAGPANVVH